MKINKQGVTIVIIAGVITPILLYLYYVIKFGVDLPRWDEWNIAEIFKAYYSKGDWVSMIFAQHNEHRIVFPRIVLLILAQLTGWNVKAEMVASWAIHVINFVLIWGILKQTRINQRWILIPIAWLMFNVGQWENMLWGWCFHWYLMIFGFICALYFLVRISQSGWNILPAIISGIVASFSFNNGLLIWPLGLVQLLSAKITKDKKLKLTLLWVIIGVFTFAIYYMDYTKPYYHPSLTLFLYNPLQFLVCMLGNFGFGLGGEKLLPSILAGLFILSIFIISFFLIKRVNKLIDLMPWFILGLFSIISVVAISIGRFGFGPGESVVSRYITIASFLIIANIVLYAVALENIGELQLRKKIRIISIMLFTVMAIGLFITMFKAWQRGRDIYLERSKAVVYLKQYQFAPNRVLSLFLHPNPDMVRDLGSFIKQKKMSVFRNEEEVNLNDYKQPITIEKEQIGAIDNVQAIPPQYSNGADEVLYISGWAIDPISQKIPKAVFIFWDGKPIGRAVLGNPRQDIRKVLNTDDFILAGWEAFLPMKGLKITGGSHMITARVLLNGPKNNYYDITKEIKIE